MKLLHSLTCPRLLAVAAALSPLATAAAAPTCQNPVIAANLADPAVIRHEGVYYLYATGEVNGDNGTRVYTSTNLVDWQRGPVVFQPGQPHVWAPDVWRDPGSGRFYLYYTVNQTVGVADEDGPLGPFTLRRKFFDRAIDAHLFRDDDGKLYLYYVQLPGLRISVQPMANPTEPAGEPRVVLQPEADWEKRAGHVTDGPLHEESSVSDATAPDTDSFGGFRIVRGKATTGQAVMIGDDPLHLTVKSLGKVQADPHPYGGRYPCGSLVYRGMWYYGTYCLSPSGQTTFGGTTYNWPWLGPLVGFRVSRDLGGTWEEAPHTPAQPLFGETGMWGHPVKIGAPHFVDYGRDMEHSPDGKAYLVATGAALNDPKPRFENLSWNTGDQVYLLRVPPSPETINDPKAYEFFAGRDAQGQPLWTRDVSRLTPLLEWNNHMGCVTIPPASRRSKSI